MELRQIITFITLAELNSFTQTAEKLGYTQPSITSQIQLLEQELGVCLFERLKKNIFLTPEGEAFLGYANQIAQLCEDSKKAMADFGSRKQILRIGTLESLASSRLSSLFKDFRAQFPDVEIVLKIADSNHFYAMLQDNKIDVAIYLDLPINHPDLTVETTVPEPLVLLASPDHPILKLTQVTALSLAEYPLILSEEGCSYRNLILDCMNASHLKPASIMEIGSTQTMRQLTISGLGITLLPRVSIQDDLSQNSLIELNWVGCPLQLMTQVVHHKDKWLSPALAAFLKLAKSHLEGAHE